MFAASTRDRRSRWAASAETACARWRGSRGWRLRRASERSAAFSRGRATLSACRAASRSARCCSAMLRADTSARTSSGTSAVSARIRSVCCSRTAVRSVVRYCRRRIQVGAR